MSRFECDALVVGGPGGSRVSALLAEHGRDVVTMEKAQHRRHHVGESIGPTTDGAGG